MTIIATGIETDIWNKVIALLVREGWTVTYKYDNIDAGIDADFVMMEKGEEEILFGWDNWFEGEIQCSETRMKTIEDAMALIFERGEPVNLKPGVINIYRRWKADNIFNDRRLSKRGR